MVGTNLLSGQERRLGPFACVIGRGGEGLDREGRLTGGYTCQAQIDAIPF